MNTPALLVIASLGSLSSVLVAAWNAWQAKCMRTEILQLKLDLIERIGETEGDVRVLDTRIKQLEHAPA